MKNFLTLILFVTAFILITMLALRLRSDGGQPSATTTPSETATASRTPTAITPKPAATGTATSAPTSTAMRMVRLYYYNERVDREKNGRLEGCDPAAILPVERQIPVGATPVQDTIRLLIRGELTAAEKAQGFTTEFPKNGFTLEGANLANGVLTLEFAEVPGFTSGGSCRVIVLRTAIERTALQFPGVNEVRFKPDAIFEP